MREILNAEMDKKGRVLMQLAHYFITKENYTPMVVRGAEGEIWLENINAPYRIIRINTNYIHNNEQLDVDFFKIKNIINKVKKTTLSFKVPTLNILIDVGSNVDVRNDSYIDCVAIDANKGIKRSKKINELYPDLSTNLVDSNENELNFLVHVTNDINKKAEKDNKEFEKVFSKKNIPVTYVLIAINFLVYLLGVIGAYTRKYDLYTAIALHRNYVQNFELWRLITAAFTHESFFHLAINMYALYIIGSQVETFMGKWKYIGVYLFSAITGCLLSCIVNTGWSLGASGAIFGLMGTLCYFGFHYRLYLDNVLKTQIIPLVIFNLALGFIIPNIDNAGHIGGLIGGVFMAMALGIDNKSSKADRINGIICSFLLVSTFIYILLFAK